MTPGTLYIVATPIGHLDDLTFRAKTVLESVSRIAAEDTRVTQKLVSHYHIKTPLLSLQAHNEAKRIDSISRILADGSDVALVSDAGTPNISDPGALLVQAIREQGYPVVPIPGPNAVATFLSACGILSNAYIFAGFFPRKKSEVSDAVVMGQSTQLPMVFFESPKRLAKSLAQLCHFQITEFAIGKELTKRFETIYQGPIELFLDQLKDPVKGEWIFMAKFSKPPAKEVAPVVADLAKLGLTHKQIVEIGHRYLQLPKNEVYKAAIT